MDDLHKRLSEVGSFLAEAYTGIRTGQATPALLDRIKVENFGSMMPINQVGSIGVEDARTLRISTWDPSVIPALERAIADADLGVSVATDSSGVRVIFPELTSERREQLIKVAKAKLEESRVSVRAVRDDVMKEVEKQEKDGEISKDGMYDLKEQIQKEVDAINATLEGLYQQKETELK